MSKFAKAYKLTGSAASACANWTTARYATASGYQLLATNWVIKQTSSSPTLGPTIDKVTGADNSGSCRRSSERQSPGAR